MPQPSKKIAAKEKVDTVQLVTLAPRHFHASLVQKLMYPGVLPVVKVYAPAGTDLDEHLKRVEAYNTRPTNPTHWQQTLYTGNDFFEKMLAEKAGNVVIIAGNNREKTDYLARSLGAFPAPGDRLDLRFTYSLFSFLVRCRRLLANFSGPILGELVHQMKIKPRNYTDEITKFTKCVCEL